MAKHMTARLAKRRSGRTRRAGFSLVETSLAAMILTIAVIGLSGSMVSSMALTRVNRETALAEAALRRAMERITGAQFAQAFVLFNTDPDDDPAGPGTAPGATFTVDGLGEVGGVPVGSIAFPTVDPGGGPELREDVADAAFGMPRDLDGDNAVDADDHAGDYRLLPVRISLRWRGMSGVRTLTVESMLCAR